MGNFYHPYIFAFVAKKLKKECLVDVFQYAANRGSKRNILKKTKSKGKKQIGDNHKLNPK